MNLATELIQLQNLSKPFFRIIILNLYVVKVGYIMVGFGRLGPFLRMKITFFASLIFGKYAWYLFIFIIKLSRNFCICDNRRKEGKILWWKFFRISMCFRFGPDSETIFQFRRWLVQQCLIFWRTKKYWQRIGRNRSKSFFLENQKNF